MLKLTITIRTTHLRIQPPSGGCVLKPDVPDGGGEPDCQPPSGGCVLKQRQGGHPCRFVRPAAFGRLCVETYRAQRHVQAAVPAAFGRLCVETRLRRRTRNPQTPAAFGRLCVETRATIRPCPSARPAAFGRLCVETSIYLFYHQICRTSRLRAAVC